MSTLSDSGFEEDLQSPSPGPHHFQRPWAENAVTGLTDDYHETEYDEICFKIQKNNEQDFLAIGCLAHQPQISAEARCKLVSWLIAVYKHFKLSFESCCLAVNIMDRFLMTTSVAADCFQLLGVTALLIATKHIEVCSPRIKQLLSLCCDAFSREQLCNLECLILLRLNFRLAAPTLAFFLDYFISREISGHGIRKDEQIVVNKQKTHKSLEANEEQLLKAQRYKCLAGKVCELSLADYTFNKFQPSVIVQSAINLANDLLRSQLKESEDKQTNLPDHRSDIPQVADDSSPVLENHFLILQCTEKLELLVSLNQESFQDLLTL